MSTNGFIGFTNEGELHGFYNHDDSYLSYLGINALRFFKENTREDMRRIISRIVWMSDKRRTGEYYQRRSNAFAYLFFDIDWRKKELFRPLYMIDIASEFKKNGLRFYYLFNIDENILSIYEIGDKEPEFMMSVTRDMDLNKIEKCFRKNEYCKSILNKVTV